MNGFIHSAYKEISFVICNPCYQALSRHLMWSSTTLTKRMKVKPNKFIFIDIQGKNAEFWRLYFVKRLTSIRSYSKQHSPGLYFPIRHFFTTTAKNTNNGRRTNNRTANIHGNNTSTMRKITVVNQPHLAQCYSRSRRIALMLYGAHESKIYFEVQLGVN